MALSKAKAPLAAAAKAAGLKVFNWPEPCKHGHGAPRRVSSGECVECIANARRKWYGANREIINAKARQVWVENPNRLRANMRAYEKRNPEARKIIAQKYREAHPEKVKKSARKWRTTHPGAKAADVAKRRCSKQAATPSWIDSRQVIAIYNKCQQITKETGILHEVDHIVPLRHKLVSGLHVPWNLQIIPAKENRQKNNTWVPSW